MLRPRLTRASAVVGALTLIGAVFWLSGRPWLTARGVDPLRGQVQVEASGRICLPWLAALLLVGIASIIYFALAADRGRVAAAIAFFLSGISIFGSICYFLIYLPFPRGQDIFGVKSSAISDVSAAPSAWLAVIGAGLWLLWGAALLLGYRAQPSSRENAVKWVDPTVEPAGVDPITAWDNLNSGQDPTK